MHAQCIYTFDAAIPLPENSLINTTDTLPIHSGREMQVFIKALFKIQKFSNSKKFKKHFIYVSLQIFQHQYHCICPPPLFPIFLATPEACPYMQTLNLFCIANFK